MGVINIIKENERERIAVENYNLIHHVAHSFNRTTGIKYEDLFSVASVGFVVALNDYRSGHGTKFSTYAYTCMRSELVRFIQKEKRIKDTFIYVDEVYPAKW